MLSAWCRVVGVWVLLTAVLLASPILAQKEPPGAPRCTHPRCKYIRYEERKDYYYEVEGNKVRIGLWSKLFLNCFGANVLESEALPRAEPAQCVRQVELWNCSLPATGSVQDTLDRLNFKFCKQDPLGDPNELWLNYRPEAPALAARHLAGFEHIPVMLIRLLTNYGEDKPASPECDFLKASKGLRWLKITGVTLPAELETLPPSLEIINLRFTGTERLPEAIYTSTKVQDLTVHEKSPLDAVAVPPGLRKLELVSPATTLRLDAAPSLENLRLFNWVEPLPPRVTSCAALREIRLTAPAMRALPNGWLASCSSLVELEIVKASNLITLPPRLFSPTNIFGIQPVTRLALKEGALEALPESLLEGLLGLETLELQQNHLKQLPRNFFKDKIKQWILLKVDLSSNDLDGGVFNVLELVKTEPQKWLTPKLAEINLSHNPRIGDVCGQDGYSRIRPLIELHKLHLHGTSVSRICRDWREEMPQLELLDLTNTSIPHLSFEDLQYKRTVQAVVRLQGAPVAAVRVTREDYNQAVRAPPSFTTMDTDVKVQCDCSMYWARRALEPSLHALDGIRSLHCVGGGLLTDVPAEELVCGAREECAAAALPAECACAARPDDDPTQDRRLVRAHCGNSSQGFVPRRMYPFYPIHRSNNQWAYVTKIITSMN